LLSQKVNGLDPIGRRAFFPEIEITQNVIRLLQTAFMYNRFNHIDNLPIFSFPVKDSLPAGFSCKRRKVPEPPTDHTDKHGWEKQYSGGRRQETEFNYEKL
jgi:hypothetical protein